MRCPSLAVHTLCGLDGMHTRAAIAGASALLPAPAAGAVVAAGRWQRAWLPSVANFVRGLH